MTSNLGSDHIQRLADSDYQIIKLAVMAEVKTHFRPEFINRIDEVVVFHGLGQEQIRHIARIQLDKLMNRLASMEIGLTVSDAALDLIAEAGFDPVYGARPLKRAIQSELENVLAKRLLAGEFSAKDTIHVDAKEGAMVFSR